MPEKKPAPVYWDPKKMSDAYAELRKSTRPENWRDSRRIAAGEAFVRLRRQAAEAEQKDIDDETKVDEIAIEPETTTPAPRSRTRSRGPRAHLGNIAIEKSAPMGSDGPSMDANIHSDVVIPGDASSLFQSSDQA